ncbi:MAG: virulence RhuM family protein [Kiritimatiellales bacterium]|nr:virulence RhuM family protein [Kiritimatiellales bacterium]
MKTNEHGMEQSRGQFLVYEAPDGRLKLDVRLEDETVWLSQQLMAELFGKDKRTISEHIQNVFKEGELEEEVVVRKFRTTTRHGAIEGKTQSKEVNYYNLDVIISVGYRVKSLQGTNFRIWATQRLREYIVKGFTMDDERLKEAGGGRYFEELLARIRDIRSSEKVFWRKVLDIYATSVDYDPQSEQSLLFFKQVQNKMHWAAHGHTAAELIYERADSERPKMGITNFPGSHVLKRDIEIAKNYLDEGELNILNRMVTAYLEIAELQALNRIPMRMKDWLERLDQFLTMTGRELLDHAGTISHEQAMLKAETEFEKYRQRQLAEPTLVERHFVEMEEKIKRIGSEEK